MSSASILARSLSVSALGLLLAAGCSGESKPAATSPAAEQSAKSADAKPSGGAGEGVEEVAKDAKTGEKVKVVEGQAPGGDDRYALHIEPPADAAAGKEGEVVVRVVPKDPWHMNLDFPTSLKVDPAAALQFVNADLKKGDARKLDEESCEFSVKFTPSEAGEHTVTGKFKFAVCQDDACSPVTEDVEFKVAVK